MRPAAFDPSVLRQHLRRHKIADLPELKRVLGTDTALTVFRKLGQLGYLASYTHRGRFYTLSDIAHFEASGARRLMVVLHMFSGFFRLLRNRQLRRPVQPLLVMGLSRRLNFLGRVRLRPWIRLRQLAAKRVYAAAAGFPTPPPPSR